MSRQESHRSDRNRGFALPELGAIVFVAALGLALLIPAASDTRRQAGLGRDIANLRQIAQWTGMYAAENEDKYWTFSWKAGNQSSQWPDLRDPTTNLGAAVFQAVDIMRRRSGRGSGPTMIAIPSSWLPHPLYSHLILADYLDRPLPDEEIFSSTSDLFRRLWASDPLGFDQGRFLPFQWDPTPSNMRWPYSTGYWLPFAYYDASPIGSRVELTGRNSLRASTRAVLEAQRLAQVHFPSTKVHLVDRESRYFGQHYFSLADSARLPFLMADASVQIHRTSSANPGWDPNRPHNPRPTSFDYYPQRWEAPTSTGQFSEPVLGRFLMTRDFLAGIDFDGRGRKRGPSDAASDDEGIASARKQWEGRVFSP